MRKREMLKQLEKKAVIGMLVFTTAFCFMIPQTAVPSHAASRGHYTALGLKAYKQKNYRQARKLFLKEPKYKENCVSKMSAARKKAYASVIRKYRKSSRHPLNYVSYTDINKDGHAEMLLQYGTGEADYRTNVYEYYSGAVHRVGGIWSGHTTYVCYPNHNGVLAVWGHMGGQRIYLYTLRHHKLSCKYYGENAVKKDSDEMEFKNELAPHNIHYAF